MPLKDFLKGETQKDHKAEAEQVSEAVKHADRLRQLGAALLEHDVCVISPVEDESLSPDVAQVMYVSVRWPWRSGLHGAA